MKEIVVISGKGGTGKTSVVASFAALAEKPVLADCDVDAADLHLVLTPKIKQKEDFSGGKCAEIMTDKCRNCGTCYELCRFGAVKQNINNETLYKIDPIACEGCGVCAWFCPEKAIKYENKVNGEWYISETRFGPMVHAKLGIAEENSGKLVTIVKKNAKEIAEKNGYSYIIVDGSPGIGCPVIASLTGADLVVIVTEPTLSGKHDLERVVDLTRHFKIPAAICVNKSDINQEITKRIKEKTNYDNLIFLGEIRYDKIVTEAQINKTTIVEYKDSMISCDIKNIWKNIILILKE